MKLEAIILLSTLLIGCSSVQNTEYFQDKEFNKEYKEKNRMYAFIPNKPILDIYYEDNFKICYKTR